MTGGDIREDLHRGTTGMKHAFHIYWQTFESLHKKWFFRIMVFFSKCDYIHNFLWTPYGFGNIYWRLLCSTNSELLISRIWLPHGVLQALDFLLLNYLNYNRLMQALVMKMVLGLTGLTVEQMLLHNVAAVAAAVYKGSYNLMVG